MKLILIAIFISQVIYANTLIISDIDDTIRQTNVLNKARAAKSVIYKAPEFSELKDIFKQLRFHYAKENVDFFYLSASPSCLLDYDSWIKEKGFPTGIVFQRPCDANWLRSNYSAVYKYQTIVDVIKKKSASWPVSRIIFFGDNAEHDPAVYQAIKKDYPHLVIEIFIRDIRVEATSIDKMLGTKKIDGVNYFLTEYELVKHPYFYFLPENQKISIYQEFKKAKLYPKYLYENLARRYVAELHLEHDDAIKLAHASLMDYLKFN